jgi:hypothetical protein
MIRSMRLFVPAALVGVLFVGSAHADVLAATDFNERTLTTVKVTNDTATNLKWTLNGLEDPGDLSAMNAGGAGQVLFNTPTAQVLFAPQINTGNGNTFWTTSVNLTVVPGSVVTLTDVTFDYWALSAAGVLNVNRRSDFTISLLDPSAVLVASVDIVDAVSGTSAVPMMPTLTATFAAPVALSAPGTYTLQIKGGDFLGADETGNHTGIDNLSINGTLRSAYLFAITEVDYDAGADRVTLTWTSSPGETYIVKFSLDMTDWSADLGDGLPADAGATTTMTFDLPVPGIGDAASVFFRVEKEPAR